MIKQFLVMDIGCIECIADSDIVGVFDSEEEADKIAKDFNERFGYYEHEQHSFEVFILPQVNIINAEYLNRE